MARAVSRWHVTAQARVRSSASQCEFCFGSSGNDTGFSLSTSLFRCQYHSTNISYATLSKCCSYQRAKCAIHGNLPKKGIALWEIWECWIEKDFQRV